jgi:hypothetical protein
MLRRLALVLALSVAHSTVAQTFTSSNLPIVIINTGGQPIPNEPKITADMGIIYNGPGQVNTITDPPNEYNGKIGIELRGSTSQQLSPKKPYGIELRDVAGNDIEAPLLGMPAGDDWVLIAPYSDKSLMRDVLTYIVARGMMDWAPRTRFCEVVLNGTYMGVFALIEKIERGKDRVDIAKLTTDDLSGDDVTGGYILKLDKTEGGGTVGGWYSEYTAGSGGSIFFQYEYPKPEVIMPQQKSYIQNFVNSYEDALKGPDYLDPDIGYARYIDEDSFVDFLIVNELTRNVDGYRLSTYLYKDKDSNNSRMKMGPVWDFNIALGNANYCDGGLTTGWAFQFNTVCPGDFWQVPFWWERLLGSPLFRNRVVNRWRELREEHLSDSNLMRLVDSLNTDLGAASARNFERWPILGSWIWPNNFVGGSYSAEINYLKNWITQRTAWLDLAMEDLTKPSYNADEYFEPIQFPNPAAAEVNFDYYVHDYEDVKITVYDSWGHSVEVLEDRSHPNGYNRLTWQPTTLATGIYLYQVLINERVATTGKFFRP